MNDSIKIIEPMNVDEARECIKKINNSAAEMGRLLLDLKERDGWKILGYETWTQCLENEFEYSRKYLYEIMRATPIIEAMSAKGYKLNTKQAEVLRQFPELVRSIVVELTVARYDNITESRLARVAEVLTQAAQTGHVNVGDGSKSVGLDAALDLEDSEAKKRQWEYKNQGITHISFKDITELVSKLVGSLNGEQFGELVTRLTEKHQSVTAS